MKKVSVILCLALSCSVTVLAQTPNTGTPPAVQTDIREKLVQLALKHPTLKETDALKSKYQASIRKVNSTWLDMIVVGVNLNEVTTGQLDQNQFGNLYFPLWNVGINVPLGSFFGKPAEKKMARMDVQMAVAKRESQELTIRATVLTRYEDYLLKKELLRLQSEMTEDDLAAFTQAEQKFTTGAIDYDAYSGASKRYNAELVKKITLERDLAVAVIELEEMIGVKLEEALAQK
ncbi:TolC family protein [Chitinophaga horti]|uniref:TolC family protein n=1 Tax=Chitinophaga horti TaxID=2920382 RepID=A0ABY6JAQ2_9BACT|nr:TolC family protein [Chitinophaga horti]UYQ95244.1 TolC family protein [Chitinophaga horti]